MLQGLLPHTLNLCRHTHSLLAEQHKQLSYVILVKGMFVCICIQMLVCVCLCVCFWCGGSILKGIVCGKKKRGREEIHLWPENTEDKLRKCCANV